MSKVQLCLCKIILVCLLLQQFQDNVHGAGKDHVHNFYLTTYLFKAYHCVASSSWNKDSIIVNYIADNNLASTLSTLSTSLFYLYLNSAASKRENCYCDEFD